MFDLLSIEEDDIAASHGWRLAPVYDLRLKRWRDSIISTGDGRHNNAEAATRHVIGMARQQIPLALKAIRLVTQGKK